MQTSRDWIENFHDNLLDLFMACVDLVGLLKSADWSDRRQCEVVLKRIRILSSWYCDIDPDSVNLIDPMKFFRLAHLRRHSVDIVEGKFASYHDFAWDTSEELLVLLRASDIVLGDRISCDVPADGPRTIEPDAIAEIVRSSPMATVDPSFVRANLQLEGTLAPTLFHPVNAAPEPQDKAVEIVKTRTKAGKCPKCASNNTNITSSPKGFRYCKCNECRHSWKEAKNRRSGCVENDP